MFYILSRKESPLDTQQATTIADWTELGIYQKIPKGINFRVVCPSCTPTRRPEHQRERDFVIAPNGETGFCHHCGFTANIRTKGVGQDNQPQTSYQPMPVPGPERAEKPANPPPSTPDTQGDVKEQWRSLLTQRGLDPDILETEFDVRFIWRQDLGPTMVIPQYHPITGELMNHKYRGLNKDFRNDTGTKRPLYNLHRCAGADTIVIVEGEMDVFAFEAAGFPHVTSVPDGAPSPGARNYATEFSYLDEAIPILLEADRIILAVDNDEPGHMLRKELEHRIGTGLCSHINFPNGIKDANDALIHLGADWLRKEVRNARPTPTSGVFTPLDAWDDIDHALKYGFDTGMPIGFPQLDKIYRPTLGHLTIITGHAGSGKSTVLDNFVIKLSIARGWPITFFSPEQMPVMRHWLSLAEIWIGNPTTKRRAELFQKEMASAKEIRNFIELIEPYLSHISPEMADDTPSLDRILELATAEVRRIGIKGLVLDPWNEIEVGRPPNITETEWVSVALGKIRRWARKHNVHVWLIAHPRKMRTDQGADAIPGLGDISGSNNFRNKADYGLTVHKTPGVVLLPGQTSTCEVIVTKARWKDSALANAQCTFVYNPANNRIETPPDSYVSQARAPQPIQAEWDPD